MYKSEKNRANCTSISDELSELDHQSLNHLLSESPWDYRGVLNEIALRTSSLFNKHPSEVALLIDEVGFRKKGKHSACVGRQYLGCIGKKDNGQVAVVAGLSTADHYSPVDGQLFMPESWQEDQYRRKKCKIPEAISHKSKPELALEMIISLTKRGLQYDYVGFDALYGNSSSVLNTLQQEGICFMADVMGQRTIYTSRPIPVIPKKKAGQTGPDYKNFHVEEKTISLSKYQQGLCDEDFEQITFRKGTKGEVKACFHQKEAWINIDDKKGVFLKVQLLIRKDMDGTIKYSLSNRHDCSIKRLAICQGQRVYVERIFEEGKNQIGLGDYQVRSWEGFHKHLTLCFLAFYYIAEQKITHQKQIRLSAANIRKLVAATIMSKWSSLDHTIQICLHNINQYQRLILYNSQKGVIT